MSFDSDLLGNFDSFAPADLPRGTAFGAWVPFRPTFGCSISKAPPFLLWLILIAWRLGSDAAYFTDYNKFPKDKILLIDSQRSPFGLPAAVFLRFASIL